MSIVNISSENKEKGNDADFEVNLKNPIHRCIGLQLLNATVPLTYNVINEDDRTLKVRINGSTVTAQLTQGTYTDLDSLAREIERAINFQIDNNNGFRNETQRNICIDNRNTRFLLSELREPSYSQKDCALKIRYDELEPGMFIEHNGTVHHIVSTDGSSTVTLNSIGSTNISNDFLVYPGILVFPDPNSKQLIFASDENSFTDFHIYGTDEGINSNTRRILKTIGSDGLDRTTLGNTLTDADRYKRFVVHHRCKFHPENVGPSILYLRIGGDVILDQQNSETSMNDRIPIPLDKAHGGIVHFENDSESDVIPFNVPCDVRKLKFRVEYGDDNTVVGGKTQNLMGHHTYFRLKFYKQHQQSKTHI